MMKIIKEINVTNFNTVVKFMQNGNHFWPVTFQNGLEVSRWACDLKVQKYIAKELAKLSEAQNEPAK